MGMGITDDHHSEHSELCLSKQPTTSEDSNSNLKRNKSKEPSKTSSLCDVSGLKSFADAYTLHLIHRAEYDSDSEEELPNAGNAAQSPSHCTSTSKKSRSLSPLIIIRSDNSTRSGSKASFDKLLQSKSNESIQNGTSVKKPSVKINSKTHSGRKKHTFNSTLPEAKSKNELSDAGKLEKGFDAFGRNTTTASNINSVSTPQLSLRDEDQYPRRVYRSTPHPKKTEHVESKAKNLFSLNSKSDFPTVASLPNFLSDQTSPSITRVQDIISKTKSSCVAAKESNENIADKEHRNLNDNFDSENSEDGFCLMLTEIGMENDCNSLSNGKKNSPHLNSNISEDKLATNMHNKKGRYSVFSDEEFVFSDSEEEREYDKNTVFGKLAVKIDDYKKYSSPTNNNADKKTQRDCKRKSENYYNLIQNKRQKNVHVNCLNPNFVFRLYSFLDEVSKSQQFKEAGQRLKEELESSLPCLGLEILTHQSCTKSNDIISSGSSSSLSGAENCLPQIPATNESCAIENHRQEQMQDRQEILKEAFKQPMQPRLKKSVRRTKKTRKEDKDKNASGKVNKSKDPLMRQKHSVNPKSLTTNTNSLTNEESNTVRRSTRFRCPTGYEVKSSEDGHNVLVRRSTYLPVERLLTKKEAEALRKNRHKNTSRKKDIFSNSAIPSSQDSQMTESQDSSVRQKHKRKLYDASDWLHSSALQSLCVN